MEHTTVKKRGPAALIALCPAAHAIALVSAALIVAFFVVFVATAGALNAGGYYLWAGILNGAVELSLLIRLFIKLMDKNKV